MSLPPTLAQPLFRLLDRPAFLFSLQLIVDGRRRQFARNRIDHRFQQADYRRELLWGKLVDQLMRVLFFISQVARHCQIPVYAIHRPISGSSR